jgi:Cyclic nucleotide-binding domain
MSMAPAYPDLFEMGQQAFVRFRDEFRLYGVEADPGLELHRSNGMLCYYDFTDRQIYLSVPDLKAPTGKLQLLMFRQMLCAETNDELMRFLGIFIPFVVAHEMTHHFRHRNGLFGADSWHEEQLANQMAAAVNKHRIAPEEREFAVQFLQRAVQKLGDELGMGESAVDSYYDIAHALQASNRLSATEMDNFRLVQGVAPDAASAATVLRASGAFAEAINERLDKRNELISSFNREYTADPTRYIYYQVGWVYLAIKGTEANYVDEFACEHLNRASQYLSITAPQTVTPRDIAALHEASRAVAASSVTLSRYFYKRYRSHLLKYIEQNQGVANESGEGQRTVNFDVLAIWDDRNNDPLNFLAGMVPPAFRSLFPAAIVNAEKSASPVSANLPADLPTPVDRVLWRHAHAAQAGEAQLTVELFERFDRLELFRALPPEIILALGKKCYTVRYAAGETLVWQGEFNNDIFILIEGQLEASAQGNDKKAPIGPGELFGEIAWLTRGSRAASVRAVAPSVCLVIKERDLQILAYQSPSILQSIAATLARRLRTYL